MCWWSAANYLQLLRVLLSAKQLKDMLRMLLTSIALEEELLFLEFALWLNYYYFVLLDSFSLG